MSNINSTEQINTILEFLKENPGMYSTRKKKNKPDPTTDQGIKEIKDIIMDAKKKMVVLKDPTTVPDPLVFYILQNHHGIHKTKKTEVETQHQWAMAAEDIIGELLEQYIDKESVANNSGWVRCYGDTVKGTDFLKKTNKDLLLLQIKNRDNSENSSSKEIRKSLKDSEGVEILKWFRTFSQTGKTNWDKFPDDDLKDILTEKKFFKFVDNWIKTTKKSDTKK